MLVNVSYNDKEITRRVNEAVGRPFSLKERWALRGIGSPKLRITDCSIPIRNLLILDNNTDYCNIELRPSGIILRFRSLLETFALVSPYYKLKIDKDGIESYRIHHDRYFVKVKADTDAIRSFFRKIMVCKADQTPSSPEDI